MKLHKMQVVLFKIRRYSDFVLFSAVVLYSMEDCAESLLCCLLSQKRAAHFGRKNKTRFFDENWLILENVNDIINGVSLYSQNSGSSFYSGDRPLMKSALFSLLIFLF